jgi:PAS domain S-box-containing protein
LETIVEQRGERFLNAGGEMAERIRNHNWSSTTMGTPDTWPRSLVNVLGIMLNAAFPMFLFWGKDLTCFYNDAFYPSLGMEGERHAIGLPAREMWQESWHFMAPVVEEVMCTGKPFLYEDKLLPFSRNGRVEDIYWTFSSSAIHGDHGEIAGVFFTGMETTEKVHNLKVLEESRDELEFAIEAAELATWDLNPASNTFTANARYTEWFGLPATQQVDNKLALQVIAEEDRERVVTAYLKALDYDAATNYEIEYTIRPKGKPERIVRAKGKVYFNDEKIAYRFNGTLQDVTKEAAVKKQLAESKHSLELAMEIGELGFFKVDLQSYISSYSLHVMKWFGLPEPSYPLQAVFMKIHPEDRLSVEDHIQRSIKGEADGRHDLIYRIGTDNETRHFVRSIGQVQFKNDKPLAVYGIIQDVTAQVNSSRKLQESEHRYRTLIEEATVATGLYIGPNFRIQYVNDIMIGYWGKDYSVIGKHLIEAVPELDGQQFLGFLNNVYRTGEPYIGKEEAAILRVDGKLQTFYFNFTYKALRDKDGEIYGIHHMALDVTSQVIAQRALQESERKFRNLVMEAPVAIAVFKGPRFEVDIANQHYLQIIGRTNAAFLGKPLFEAVPEIREQVEPVAKEILRTGLPVKMNEYKIVLNRGGNLETAYFNSAWEPLHEADGSVGGFIILAVEVTAQVLARQKIEEVVAQRTRELAEANKALRDNNRELEQFAYIASHDLQEPLRKVRTYTGLLKSSLAQNDERSNVYLAKIADSSARMSQLIGDVLNFSQLSKTKQPFTKVDLKEVINRVLEDFELLIQEKQAVVIVNTLPVIEGIQIQMEQLFSNLVSNALKFSRSETPPVIKVTGSLLQAAESDGQEGLVQDMPYYKITIEDNGIGFEEQYAAQIFNIFQRLHSRSDYVGTGIGLAICKKIVQIHHGDIRATATAGKGAVFTVILPQKQREICDL